MAASERIQNEFVRELERVRTALPAAVVSVYRKEVSGGYAALFWVSEYEGSAPPLVSSASDLAAYLRTEGNKPFQMSFDTFADGMVRYGLEVFGISHLMVAPLETETKAHYFLTVGASDTFDAEQQRKVVDAADRLSQLFVRDALQARIRGCGRFSLDHATMDAKDLFARSRDTAAWSLIALTLREYTFRDIAFHTLNAFSEDAQGVLIEDMNGRLLAAAPEHTKDPRSREWLSSPRRLPYLDWMEESTQAILVPAECDEAGLGRLIIPLVNAGQMVGLVSVLGMQEQSVDTSAELLSALIFACSYLLCKREASRSHVLSKLLNSVENERMRLAFELHDETSQNLVALKVLLSAAQRALGRNCCADANRMVEDCVRIADGVLNGVNRLSASLRSSELNYLGLHQAIEAAAHTRLDRAGVAFCFSGNALDVRFNALQETMLLAGVDEALSNCAKHARAQRVEITMEDDGSWLTIAVRDDGVGFNISAASTDLEQVGYGIRSMYDCAEVIGGDFWIGSSLGKGTTVRFSVPNCMLEEGEDG